MNVEKDGPYIAGDGIRTNPLTGQGCGGCERSSMPLLAHDFVDYARGVVDAVEVDRGTQYLSVNSCTTPACLTDISAGASVIASSSCSVDDLVRCH